ncbi:peptidase S9 prolyl oligopeptidase [Rufibacter radiotolerans]|uniref:Peptidase S9 prolyl oligopeptidase n=1 Tax=Rufibacter radiotolerans TaxID=1379910 RepID=A0A0H4VUW1_9BACT|nr:S9 family peptidase [Rufibacter radiotolerans]AKQ47614.1 peptidase S9 prolyl oligopeptidase [Rufibacter radiotolerans]
MKIWFCLLVVLSSIGNVAAQMGSSVSFEKVISLKQVGSPLISPDGKSIVYSVTSTDWASNNYDTELWLSHNGAAPQPLTRTAKGSSTSARITPDSKFVSFLADRGEKNQLYIIPVTGGEALQVSKDEDGVGSYEWSPDGKRLAYTKAEADSKVEKTTKDRFGAFFIEGEDFKRSHLWLLNFHYDSISLAGQLPCYAVKKDSLPSSSTPAVHLQDCVKLPMARKITSGDFTVTNFQWSPDGKTIAFNRQPNPLINSSLRSDIVTINVDTKEMKTLVSNPTGDFFTRWSPDGKAFVYSSSLNDSTTYYFKNNRLFIYDTQTAKSREISQAIDENKNVLDWNKNGIYLVALEKTRQMVFEVDPKTGKSKALNLGLDLVANVAFSKNTDLVAVSGRNHADLGEIYTGKLNRSLKKLTNTTEQIKGWNTPTNEVITWQSTDGASIDGVLLKPRNYDAAKKYPLLIVIHGGPTAIDLPDPTPSYVYPMLQWVEKGALVLRVNYRGSAGYGEKFRSLNVRNLGVGDMWDVMSGVEYLAKKNMIDTTKMGSMGWSQGGYISAFLTTNTNRFKAISVGAGISNWVTYYVNTDVTPFTRQYLQATPWSDMDIYLKTSPMTNINKASTPTLIQHGEFDKRVPLPNAYELYRGLQDRGVPSRLIIYKGFGHGINKPKERLAATWHNWQWFNHYVFGEKEPTLPIE